MCGIAGWIEKDCMMTERRETLQAISETLTRRGPDENGIYLNGDVALIHRRLVVIDREVLKAFIQYGERCPEKLNGIFAFAVFNTRDRTLFLCRDKIGVKPLFYHEYDGGLIFGSEIKALLKSGVVKPQIDEQGLNEIFFLGPARTPSCGVFKGVFELNPGECAVYKNGRLRRRTYFSIEAREHGENEAETIETTRYLLTDAIQRQLISDVPRCLFLSGGLDSSIIVKTAAMYHRENRMGRVHTYSVEYRDNAEFFQKSLFQPNKDSDYIGLMVKDADTKHREVILDNKLLADALYDSVEARDLPRDTRTSTLRCCSFAAK